MYLISRSNICWCSLPRSSLLRSSISSSLSEPPYSLRSGRYCLTLFSSSSSSFEGWPTSLSVLVRSVSFTVLCSRDLSGLYRIFPTLFFLRGFISFRSSSSFGSICSFMCFACTRFFANTAGWWTKGAFIPMNLPRLYKTSRPALYISSRLSKLTERSGPSYSPFESSKV